MSRRATRAGDANFIGSSGRALLVSHLSAALARLADRTGVVVVVAVGLDRLSQINETWGYESGDLVLEQVVDRLARCPKNESIVARIGGDQFIIVWEAPESEDIEAEIAEFIMNAISGRYAIGQHTVYLTASIGVAGVADADEDAESLLSAAETARAEANRHGGHRWERADQAMRIRVREQLRTEQALYGAIEHEELHAHYQPIIDCGNGRAVALEALARWQSPVLGTIPPTHFIPRAEETGLIVPIGHWMIEEVVRHWSGWKGPTSLLPPAVGVNVSGIQFRLDLDELVSHLVKASDALPGRLWVEITESMLLEDPKGARTTLAHLRARGIGLVVDDFGTGYSSLNQLRRLPVDAIKIDRVFVARIHESPRDRAIVEAMIQLAHALGIIAVAEGVETRQQFAALREMACDQVQGFLFSPAAPFEQIEKRLRSDAFLVSD